MTSTEPAHRPAQRRLSCVLALETPSVLQRLAVQHCPGGVDPSRKDYHNLLPFLNILPARYVSGQRGPLSSHRPESVVLLHAMQPLSAAHRKGKLHRLGGTTPLPREGLAGRRYNHPGSPAPGGSLRLGLCSWLPDNTLRPSHLSTVFTLPPAPSASTGTDAHPPSPTHLLTFSLLGLHALASRHHPYFRQALASPCGSFHTTCWIVR